MPKSQQNVVNAMDSATIEVVAPPLTGFVEVSGALRPFAEDERLRDLAKIALGHLGKGEERLRRLFETSSRDSEAAKLKAIKQPPKVFDLKELEKRLRASVKSLDSLLTSDLAPAVLTAERAKHKSIEDLAAGLVGLAEALDDEAVNVVAERVKAEDPKNPPWGARGNF